MTRLMVDGTGANANAIKREFPHPDLICFYVTGSPDIEWTDAEKALFSSTTFVTIDQGGHGSPVADAMVRDVEPGAWTPVKAVNAKPWTPPRPTVYCDRNDLPKVIADGWRGDVWLAWPGFSGAAAPSFPGVNVVAVQNVFGTDHDTSLVFDKTWPHVAITPPPAPHMSITVSHRTANLAFSVLPTAGHYVIEYRATMAAQNVLIGREPQVRSGSVVHVLDLEVPGAHGGEVYVYGIVASKPVLIGAATLP